MNQTPNANSDVASSPRDLGGRIKIFGRLVPFIKPYAGRTALAFTALSVAAAASLAMPVAVRRLVDAGLLNDPSVSLDRYFAVLIALVLVVAVAASARFYLVMWLGERIVADLRNAVYAHVIKLDPEFFETTRTGEVLSRLTTDTTLVQSLVGAGVSIALRSSFMLLGSLIMLAVTSPRLTGLILLLVPLVVIPLVVFGRRVRGLSRDSQDRIAESSGIAGETLDAVQLVQAFTLEDYHSLRFAKSVEAAFDTARRRIFFRALLSAFAIMVVFGAVTFVLWIGTRQVMENQMTAGELSQFLLYALMVATSTAALSEVWGDVQRASGAIERLMELLRAEASIRAPAQAKFLPALQPARIRFDNVSFNYPAHPERSAIVDFRLDVEPGETLALVGPSGAGKSTVFKLLLRFYDPQAGHILVNGVNIAETTLHGLRSQIGIVPQETVLFATDVMENIRHGRPDADDEEVLSAARLALVDVFAGRLPDGYQSFLGERGVRLSGGQRQRIAIARAILKNAPLLLLDEATSSLDAESEKLVQEALEHLLKDRTTLVIAHRLATILKANRIAVMDHGALIAAGTHAELIAQDGLYARLAALQFDAALGFDAASRIPMGELNRAPG